MPSAFTSRMCLTISRSSAPIFQISPTIRLPLLISIERSPVTRNGWSMVIGSHNISQPSGRRSPRRLATRQKLPSLSEMKLKKSRSTLTKTVCDLLKDGTILCAPTTPDVAPLRGHADIPEVRLPLLRLTALASLSGLPVVSVPLWKRDNLPLGVSFMAGPNRDEDLARARDSKFRLD